MWVCLQALDLKPNYVRAWSNMGIGYANQVNFFSFVHKWIDFVPITELTFQTNEGNCVALVLLLILRNQKIGGRVNTRSLFDIIFGPWLWIPKQIMLGNTYVSHSGTCVSHCNWFRSLQFTKIPCIYMPRLEHLISQFGTLCIACLPCSFDQILCLRLSVNCFAVVHHDLIWLMPVTSKTWNYFRRSILSDSSTCMHVPQHLFAHKFVDGWAAYTSYHIRRYWPQ